MRWKSCIFSIAFLASSLSSVTWADLFPEIGPPGTTVTIGGGAFGEFVSTGVNKVEFNGASALIQLWEPDLIMVKVPLAAKTGDVTVQTAETTLSVGQYSVKKVTISKLVPSEVESGDILVIEGKYFGNTAGSRDPNTMFGVNKVLINGVKAQIRRWRPGKIEVIVPATASSGDVVVKLASSDPLPDGSCCAPVDYVVSNPVPLTHIPTIAYEPKKAPVGGKVVLSAQDFGEHQVDQDTILFNGKRALIAEWSERIIVVHVPLNASSGELTITRGQKVRSLGHFAVVQSLVTSMSPAAGPIGTLIRIKGENFGVYSEGGSTAYAFDFDQGGNVIEVGGVPAIIHRWLDNEINVWVPFSAKSGDVIIRRGGSIPNDDGTCCATKEMVNLKAGTFTLETPTVTSYAPKEAGLDEIVTIKGSGFGSFIKIAEQGAFELNVGGHNWESYELGPDVSRSEVLLNGIAAQVVLWTEHEIQVRVPRRHVFGITNPKGFVDNPTEGELVVRRGSWDMTEKGTCCSRKQWVSAVAGDFTILRRGLPHKNFYDDYVTIRDE